ncbi:MAG TPA: 16S rRNA (adenine(1518)-N(6)/adenine(1519)-N(6))-dimethyltransferase RsmA [Deinococcales bacterium]|nr:16S rRNA (adenine(1518)-N(6)/adenine(1519)-N(6))-dimethyltransferase RsmA [Deinococcales bacterium]
MNPDPLYSPRVVRDLLDRHGLKPTRSLGQNFLIDGNVLRLIVTAAGVNEASSVLEVGPGLGVLTAALAETGARVTTVEKDARLAPVLRETLGGFPNVQVVLEDALTFDLGVLPSGSVFVSNLPYYVSTAILNRMLGSGKFDRLTVLVHREVADRLTARPNEAAFGFLSAVIGLAGTATRVRDVPKNAFYPAPDVTSSIVTITPTPGAAVPAGVVRVLEAALHHRRKTLRNNLNLAGFPAERVTAALADTGLSGDERAEALPLAVYPRLAAALGTLEG